MNPGDGGPPLGVAVRPGEGPGPAIGEEAQEQQRGGPEGDDEDAEDGQEQEEGGVAELFETVAHGNLGPVVARSKRDKRLVPETGVSRRRGR